MHLNLHGNWTGEHAGAWRVGADGHTAAFRLDYYLSLVKAAERGLFDAAFYAAALALQEGPGRPATAGIDPVVLASALAVNTEHIGLVTTISTTFNEPYNVARTMLTLDHLSGGRAGWNIVTTYDEMAARNYGMTQLPPKAERYARAAEFVEVVLKLWESWGEGSLVPRPGGAVPHGPAIRPIDHAGRYFDVRGPLQTPRSPQGRPILFQAGASEEGKAFAARVADGIFCAAIELGTTQAYYRDMKARIRQGGRDPDKVHIIPGVYMYLGSTMAEARRVLERESASDDALHQLARRLCAPVEALDPDETVPDKILDGALVNPESHGHSAAMVDLFRRERLTVRQFLARQPVRGPHRVVVGTPETVVQTLEEWFAARAADGFSIGNLSLDGLNLFVDEVVPVLQRRNLYRREYEGRTLREVFAG